MKFVSNTIFFLAIGGALSGCGGMNNYLAEKSETVEYYRIFDLKTTVNRQAIAKAATNGLGRNVNNARTATPIPRTGEVPAEAGRFQIENPLKGTGFGACT